MFAHLDQYRVMSRLQKGDPRWVVCQANMEKGDTEDDF